MTGVATQFWLFESTRNEIAGGTNWNSIDILSTITDASVIVFLNTLVWLIGQILSLIHGSFLSNV